MRLRAAAALLVLASAGCSSGDRAAQEQPVRVTSPSASAAIASPSPSPSPQAAASATRAAVAASPAYAFPVTGCRSSYGHDHHNCAAVDVFAARGCRIVSVTAGVVDEVSRTDAWDAARDDGATRGGLSVSVLGDDGVRYYYSHFDALEARVQPGRRVASGEGLGTVGTSGSARSTPPHLHFGLSWPTSPGTWWVRRGMVAPAGFLDDWRAGRPTSPAAAVQARRAEVGDVPACRARC